MTDHLPECDYSDNDLEFPESWTINCCICDRLRACEQRVLETARAAIDRVASDMANWNSAETAAATNATPDLSVDQWMWAQRGVHRAIAAIDALREEP